MAEGFSLADQIFNADSIADLAREFASVVPEFDTAVFEAEVLSGFTDREFMARIDWIADCLERRLASDFPSMADQLEAAMVAPLDPKKRDGDFGRFIHTIPGVMAVRHGLEEHRDRALDLLYEATKRFSMEFYIRPFINRWPEETLSRLAEWAKDENYHVRRLVSEGTRPKLPWAKKIDIGTDIPLPLLDMLHADNARFVTRSVANHLNDIAKVDPDAVVKRLSDWAKQGRQTPKELAWMTRHALRTLVKQGHPEALALLGFRADAPVSLNDFSMKSQQIQAGEAIEFEFSLSATDRNPVIVDYLIYFQRKDGSQSPKVFKLKQAVLAAGKSQTFMKVHKLKANATTFRLYEGTHRLAIQVNGRVLGEVAFELTV